MVNKPIGTHYKSETVVPLCVLDGNNFYTRFFQYGMDDFRIFCRMWMIPVQAKCIQTDTAPTKINAFLSQFQGMSGNLLWRFQECVCLPAGS